MSYIQTYSKRWINFADPAASQICFEDIERSLTVLPRFLGSTEEVRPVSDHLILTVYILKALGAPEETWIHGFVHDFSEAYTGDIVAPLKRLLPEIKGIEDGLLQATYQTFNLPPLTKEIKAWVKRADTLALCIERTRLQPTDDSWDFSEEFWEEVFELVSLYDKAPKGPDAFRAMAEMFGIR